MFLPRRFCGHCGHNHICLSSKEENALVSSGPKKKSAANGGVQPVTEPLYDGDTKDTSFLDSCQVSKVKNR